MRTMMNYERLIANCDTMIGWGHYYKSDLGNRLLDTHKECVVVKTKEIEYSTMIEIIVIICVANIVVSAFA